MKTLIALIFLNFAFQGICYSKDISYHFQKMSYSKFLDENKLTVIVTFDGSKYIERWQEILDFGKKNNVKFTFFISGVLFITDDEKNKYLYPPDPAKKGISDMGFGGSIAEVKKRKELVFDSLKEGHDIECHLNGHFDASRWNEKAWELEFKQFFEFCKFIKKPIRHVRFPLLAMNRKVYNVMPEFEMKSIVSMIENDFEDFNIISTKYLGRPYVFLEFPISYEIMRKSKVLMMDYNFYFQDKKYNFRTEKAQKEMTDYYLLEADKCFKERRPFIISHHFMEWNNDAYWDALQKVIPLLKKKYSVEFITISDLYKRISIYPSVMEGNFLDRMSIFFDTFFQKETRE